ncbi:MAG: NAD-dependent epimerase/dehydratase family protein [Clostridia bacterium]|nr:NAD-dependent epimerase/dehydratase family protein [Clostridia bacterium]MBQ4158179.1 NAD-dependent epimerase/dehydratase family protein [Clostridia bacterium]
MEKKVLVLGGTGALGSYLVPELVNMGMRVHVVSLDDITSDNPMLTYEKNNAMDDAVVNHLLKGKYDAVVDYMGYGTEHFRKRYKMFLDQTSQYVFLSSYRVYADSEGLVTENTPRLLDVLDTLDPDFAAGDDYSLSKARQEDMLTSSGYKNFTIVRPAITFSSHKFQLITMEANSFINRAIDKKTVVLPEGAMDIRGTLNWSYDVGKPMSRLVLNDKAIGETYTLATGENHTWREFAEIYKELIGMEYVTCDDETFLQIFDNGAPWARWRLIYDREFNRAIDNSKLLKDTGLTQSVFTPVKEALRQELTKVLKEDETWCRSNIGPISYEGINGRMDRYLAEGKL